MTEGEERGREWREGRGGEGRGGEGGEGRGGEGREERGGEGGRVAQKCCGSFKWNTNPVV